MADVGVRVLVDDVSVAVDDATSMATVVHVYGADDPAGAMEATSLPRRLESVGWRSLLVVPSSPAWDDVAVLMASPRCRLIRTPAAARGGRVSRLGALRGVAGRSRWLAAQDAVVVHAHDDVAALAWSPVVRRIGLPMVWDVDLGVAPDLADVVRLAGTSHLLTTGDGARLRRRRQPPSRRLDDPDAEGAVSLLDEVYRCLTGIRPASTPSAAHDHRALVGRA